MKEHISKELRKNQTPWERKLWNEIRNRKTNSLKFRRQFKVGKYITDFCCLEKMLIIELDGGHHNDDSIKKEDAIRQKYLESLGYRVLRFWNNEIDNNLEGVINKIIQAS